MIPKAELHIHIEGAISPALARELAIKNNILLPSSIFSANDVYAWNGFPGFIKAYDAIASLIKTPEDSTRVIDEYLRKNASEDVLYTEFMISPTHYAAQGMNYQEMLGSAAEAIDRVSQETGMNARILIAAVRHEGVEKVENVIQEMIANPHPYVVGINLAGDEVNFPPKLFAAAFKAAHDAGYGCVAHAGEICGPQSIWEALEYLPISRIGHGVRSIEDPKLIEELKKRNITLEVCPTSNISLAIYPNYESHPLRQLYEAGVKVTLNSDDPYFFDTSIGHEYKIAQERMGMTEEDLNNITRIAIENSFADNEIKPY